MSKIKTPKDVEREAHSLAKDHVSNGRLEPIILTETEFGLLHSVSSEDSKSIFQKEYNKSFKKALLFKQEEEKRIQSLVDRDLKNYLDKIELYSNPTRTFQLGDKVDAILANWNDCEVIAVHESGLFYLISYSSDNFGKFTSEHKMWKPWFELRKTVTQEVENFNKRKENALYNISFHNCLLGSLISKYFRFGIEMNPEYQRGLVWTHQEKEKLIESIFEGIEIGKFVFIHLNYEPNKPNYEILDGKQRLSTIIEFITDRFTYKGKLYSELSSEDHTYFENFNVTSGDTREELTLEQKAKYFLRLNVSGVPQSEEHLNKVRKIAGQ